MRLDIPTLSATSDPLEVGPPTTPKGDVLTVAEVWQRHWIFDYQAICDSWENARLHPGAREQLQPEFGAKTFLESVSLHHASQRWIQATGHVLAELEALPGSADCSKFALVLAHLAAPWEHQSNWISGFAMRETPGASIDGVSDSWNTAIQSFEADLDELRTVEQLEQAIGRASEILMRIALVRFAHIKFAHIDIAHSIGIHPEHPFHHNLHMIEGGEMDFALTIMGHLSGLADRYHKHSFPYELATAPYEERDRKLAAAGFDLGGTIVEWRAYALRDMIMDNLQVPDHPRPLLDIERTFTIFDRTY